VLAVELTQSFVPLVFPDRLNAILKHIPNYELAVEIVAAGHYVPVPQDLHDRTRYHGTEGLAMLFLWIVGSPGTIVVKVTELHFCASDPLNCESHAFRNRSDVLDTKGRLSGLEFLFESNKVQNVPSCLIVLQSPVDVLILRGTDAVEADLNFVHTGAYNISGQIPLQERCIGNEEETRIGQLLSGVANLLNKVFVEQGFTKTLEVEVLQGGWVELIDDRPEIFKRHSAHRATQLLSRTDRASRITERGILHPDLFG
jgi:hypothetical protein